MLGEIRGEVRFKEPLSFHTSLRIGGTADIFVVPQDVEDIRLALVGKRRNTRQRPWPPRPQRLRCGRRTHRRRW